MKITKYIILATITCMFMVSCSEEGFITTETLQRSKEITKSDDVISTASLPQPILDYITSNYPNIMVQKAEVESNGNYEVTLENNLELIFNSNGEFLGIDDDEHDDYGDSYINPANLPQIILDFITTNYPGETIEEAEIENNNNYEVELSNDLTLVFDENGNFLGIGVDHNDMDEANDDNEDDYSNINPSDLPQLVLDYITTNYPDETIIQAEIEDNGYFEVTLNNGIELYFDSEGNFISAEDENGEENIDPASLPQIILDYIMTNYPNETIIDAELESNGEYEVTLSNGLELYFDENGNFLREEDDDNDFDDDDCLNCTQQQVLDILTTCSDWVVDELELNGNDLEDNYIGYTFNFSSDGTLTVQESSNNFSGTWSSSGSGENIIIVINIPSLPDFNANWELHEIEKEDGESEIELKLGEDELEFESTCN